MSLDSATKTWEQVDSLVETALAAYLSTCRTLESSVSEDNANLNTSGTISLLQHRLDTFQSQFIQPLIDARLCLARAQNRLTKTAYCLPDEVLAEIFLLTINSTTSSSYFSLLDYEIRLRYSALHRLLGVCTEWRRVGVSHGALWSLIPLVTTRSRQAINYTLGRSKKSRLHLAGMVDSITPLIWMNSGLAECGPRVSSANLYAAGDSEQRDPKPIRDTISTLLKFSKPGLLAELSFHYWSRSTSHESDYLFPKNSAEDALFARFADSLSSLRIAGFNLHWSSMEFSGLVELRLQDVIIGNTNLAAFLRAAASALQLRILQILCITTCNDSLGLSQSDQLPSNPPVSLPSLGCLYLKDLYQDTLLLVLRSINPGTHRVILEYGSNNCFCTHGPDGEDYVGPEPLRLQGLKADVLMLAEECVDDDELCPLLESISTLKELYIHDWHLTRSTLKALTRPSKDTTHGGTVKFPELHSLYLTSCDIDDFPNTTEFKEMIASHKIHNLGLSVAFKVMRAPDGPSHRLSDLDNPDSDDEEDEINGGVGQGKEDEEDGDDGDGSDDNDDSRDSEDSDDSDNSSDADYFREGCPLTDPRVSLLKAWLDLTVPNVDYLVYAEDLAEPNFETFKWKLW
ncbi:unnamed protein product [Rhizoctonia solani]|uniref:F-box domain-containing protein n=3 Tax=Rhizoctonia solani TaxID=456999 RepID=A0A8H2WTS0_9AGAM|nr:unnamed protein product [Rhizoctonia solani]CAE6511597.1 unnamed protein product [Rhizoctonia solani]